MRAATPARLAIRASRLPSFAPLQAPPAAYAVCCSLFLRRKHAVVHRLQQAAAASGDADQPSSRPAVPQPPAPSPPGRNPDAVPSSSLEDQLAGVCSRITSLFPLWVVLAAAGALTAPQVFKLPPGFIASGLGFTMLGMGLTMRLSDFSDVFRRMPALLLLGMALQVRSRVCRSLPVPSARSPISEIHVSPAALPAALPVVLRLRPSLTPCQTCLRAVHRYAGPRLPIQPPRGPLRSPGCRHRCAIGLPWRYR
jgi:hypothetical protein